MTSDGGERQSKAVVGSQPEEKAEEKEITTRRGISGKEGEIWTAMKGCILILRLI
jgi:hypothetical protein